MTAITPSRRIDARFAALKERDEAGLVTFVTAGDPDFETSLEILRGLPAAGADMIELGMPFSDPMADGPAIQAAGVRALKAGQTMHRTLEMVRRFREEDGETPIILMGYYNPIYVYGVAAFVADARAAGVDGLIIVDLPPEEDDELCVPAMAGGLHFIRLATPTTDDKRLPTVLARTSGFLYYVSITGITGTAKSDTAGVAAALGRIREHTDLPIAVGFGISTPEDAAALAGMADAVVVGSAIVRQIADYLDADGRARDGLRDRVFAFVRSLKTGMQRRKTA